MYSLVKKEMKGMDEKKVPRNGLIDVMRLGFAVLIMMYHFYSNGKKHFPGGFLGVEFFVILAGFLMFSAWDRNQVSKVPLEKRQQYWLGYMKKRYIRFFWLCLPAFLLIFFIVRIWKCELAGIAKICDALSGDIWEILLVKMNGLNRGVWQLHTNTWTMSCMLFAEFFILGMLTFLEKPFLSFIMPLSLMAGIGYWANLKVVDIWAFHTFFTFVVLRVYLLMCVGVLSYLLCQRIKNISFSTIGRWVLTTAELSGYTVCMLIALYRNSIYYQFCFILITALVLAVSFSGKSFAGSALPANGFTNFCAELSLNLYLSHGAVLYSFRYLFKDVDDLYRQKYVFLFCALAAALAYTYIMRGVFKLLPIIKEKLRSAMLEE